MPSGKIANPELCREKAESVLTCFNDVTIVSDGCKSSYDATKSCINQCWKKFSTFSHPKCANLLDAYMRCGGNSK
jgi:hypothetical protein